MKLKLSKLMILFIFAFVSFFGLPSASPAAETSASEGCFVRDDSGYLNTNRMNISTSQQGLHCNDSADTISHTIDTPLMFETGALQTGLKSVYLPMGESLSCISEGVKAQEQTRPILKNLTPFTKSIGELQTRKVAFVTGVTRGIGRALAEKLLEVGVDVIGVASNAERLEEFSKQITEQGTLNRGMGSLKTITADLSTLHGVDSVIPQVGNVILDLLVHNAGIITPLGTDVLMEASDEDMLKIFWVNEIAPILLTKKLALNLRQGTRILLVSSRAGDRAGPGSGLYSITKAAIERYVESLRKDKPYGVLATSVNPGNVDTDMHADLRKPDPNIFPRATEFRALEGILTPPKISGEYIAWLLLNTSDDEYSGKNKHDIYDQEQQKKWSPREVLDPCVKKEIPEIERKSEIK